MPRNGAWYNCFADRADQAGFTMIEVLLSLLLLYLISGLVANVIAVTSLNINWSGQQTLALAYASSLLEEMKVHPDHYVIIGEHYSVNSDLVSCQAAKPEGMEAQLEVGPVPDTPAIYRVNICVSGERGGRRWEECLLGYVRLDPATL